MRAASRIVLVASASWRCAKVKLRRWDVVGAQMASASPSSFLSSSATPVRPEPAANNVRPRSFLASTIALPPERRASWSRLKERLKVSRVCPFSIEARGASSIAASFVSSSVPAVPFFPLNARATSLGANGLADRATTLATATTCSGRALGQSRSTFFALVPLRSCRTTWAGFFRRDFAWKEGRTHRICPARSSSARSSFKATSLTSISSCSKSRGQPYASATASSICW